jgi:hypothetical protein
MLVGNTFLLKIIVDCKSSSTYTEARMPSEQKWYALTGRVVV